METNKHSSKGIAVVAGASAGFAEDCVDAALARLDQDEAVTLPSPEEMQLWKVFDDARIN